MDGRAKIDLGKPPLRPELFAEGLEQFRCVQREDRLFPWFVFDERLFQGIHWEKKDILVKSSDPIAGL